MAGNAMLYAAVGFLAGMVLGGKVRELIAQLPPPLNVNIPTFYASSYPATIDYPATTATTLHASVDGRDYDSALESHINHIPID